MSYLSKEEVQKRVQEHYILAKEHGDVMCVLLKGSQNYSKTLFHESSDVDTVAVMIPSVEEMVSAPSSQSTVKSIKVGDEIISTKDIRSFFVELLAPSYTLLEAVFSEYIVVNPKYAELFERLKELAVELSKLKKKPLLESLLRSVDRETKALIKIVSNSKSIGPLEYKKLSHIFRLTETIKALIEGVHYSEALSAFGEEELFKLKYGTTLTITEFTSTLYKNLESLEDYKEKISKLETQDSEYLSDEVKTISIASIAYKFSEF